MGPDPVIQLPTLAPDSPADPDDEEPKAESVSTPGPSSDPFPPNICQTDAMETDVHESRRRYHLAWPAAATSTSTNTSISMPTHVDCCCGRCHQHHRHFDNHDDTGTCGMPPPPPLPPAPPAPRQRRQYHLVWPAAAAAQHHRHMSACWCWC
jgi:hypothetical protein